MRRIANFGRGTLDLANTTSAHRYRQQWTVRTAHCAGRCRSLCKALTEICYRYMGTNDMQLERISVYYNEVIVFPLCNSEMWLTHNFLPGRW